MAQLIYVIICRRLASAELVVYQCLSGGRLCTLIGVPWRGVSFSTLSTGRFVLKQYICKGAESAEHAETAGYTYEGTPTTAWVYISWPMAWSSRENEQRRRTEIRDQTTVSEVRSAIEWHRCEMAPSMPPVLQPVSITRFPSFRTKTLENLNHYLWKNGFLSNPDPGENLVSGNLVMETGCRSGRPAFKASGPGLARSRLPIPATVGVAFLRTEWPADRSTRGVTKGHKKTHKSTRTTKWLTRNPPSRATAPFHRQRLCRYYYYYYYY